MELEIELAKRGWTLDDVDDLVLASYDDLKLRPIMERLTSQEAKQRKVLEWYGDQQHPLPKSRPARSVYDAGGRGLIVLQTGPEPTRGLYVDGELAHRASDFDPEQVAVDYPTPEWVRLPPLKDDERAAEEQPKAKRPRHRHPNPIPEAAIKSLMWELTQRKARPGDRELTQENIALRVGLDRSRVVQAEALRRAGWDLLRTHPDFSAEDGFVRWPSPKEAARLLASGRAEN